MKKILLLAVILSNFFGWNETKAQTAPIRPITFPVIGSVTYWDDFGAPRDAGARSHKGNDLMGRKMLPLVAAVDGTIRSVTYPERDYGYSVTIQDDEGYTYHYIHMNNDVPGTDNGKGDGMNAYAIDMKRGNRVVAGQLIGWMGDSGNAEPTQAHLHFEIRLNGEPFSPYGSLKAAKKITKPVDYPQLPNEMLPYSGFMGGANVAIGNLDADADPEIVTAAGTGGGPHIQIYDEGVNQPKSGFFAYAVGFKGGVDVAVGDLDGDGVDEIITGPISGGAAHVKAFKADGTEILSFMAYPEIFRGGIKISAADLTSDGKAEIVTAPNKGGGPHVKIFQPNGQLYWDFFAYDKSFTGGIDVAATKSAAPFPPSIVTSPGPGGGPHVKMFDAHGSILSEFMAYDPNHRGGVRVTVSAREIITAPLLGGPDFRKFSLIGIPMDSDTPFEVWWPGSWDIATYNGFTVASTGPNTKRRTSVRVVDFDHIFVPEPLQEDLD
jgi:hypothetical protein